MALDRRTFLKKGVAGFGSIMLIPSCVKSFSPFGFFTSGETGCVVAMCERMIPEDEHGGGATAAGVIHYIDRQLIAVFDYDQVVYQRGIASLQANSLDLFGKRFESLDPGDQDTLLRRMESGGLPEEHWEGVDQRRFFNRVLSHTMQGFYGAPRHGGNRDYMSYRMMGLDIPLLIGRNHYQQQT